MVFKFCSLSNCVASSIETYLTFLSTSSTIDKILNNRGKWDFLHVKASKKLMGTLGHQNHKRLPDCVVQCVCQLFPDENESYVGFQQHCKFHEINRANDSKCSIEPKYDTSELFLISTSKTESKSGESYSHVSCFHCDNINKYALTFEHNCIS